MQNTKKRAIIISFNQDLAEIIDLVETLDYKVIKSFIQKRTHPDVKSYIGKGKISQINDYISNYEADIDLIIIDGNLKPSQWFYLEKKFNTDVYDRIRLILAIFDKRAEGNEAKLQVKLAQLEYERPFVRELIHRARSGEHPGLMAGGEYQVDDYYEMIKKQMKKIKTKLSQIRNERKLRRQHRHKGGFYLVSLAGYTNAGKSSLLNILSDEQVNVEGKLFSTLSTTTRKLKDTNLPILLSDTVGFIRNLPAWIVDAFHSTLEEIEVADVVILVVDASEEKELVSEKMNVSIQELIEIGVNSPIIIAFNKVDKISEEQKTELIKYLEFEGVLKDKKIVFISVIKNQNIAELLDILINSLPQLTRFKIDIPMKKNTQSLVSWIYEKANVLDINYSNKVKMHIESSISTRDMIISKCEEIISDKE